MINRIFHKVWFGLEVLKIYKTWPTAFLDYFGLLGKRKINHILRGGVKYEIRSGTNDFGIINEVYIVKEYNPLIKFIRNDSVVIDIGAQVGAFSIFASRIAKNGRVFSFEPFAENFKMLKKNISLNSAFNILHIEKAVGGKEGKRDLVISKENSGGHSFYETRGENVGVDTITLKQVFEMNKISKCNFLKMDCEGAEFEILFNTPKKYLAKIDSIAMEYHSEGGNVLELKEFPPSL